MAKQKQLPVIEWGPVAIKQVVNNVHGIMLQLDTERESVDITVTPQGHIGYGPVFKKVH